MKNDRKLKLVAFFAGWKSGLVESLQITATLVLLVSAVWLLGLAHDRRMFAVALGFTWELVRQTPSWAWVASFLYG